MIPECDGTIRNIRFILLEQKDGVVTDIIFYHVGEQGQITSRDIKQDHPLPAAMGDYLCLHCLLGFVYWNDALWHFSEQSLLYDAA